MVKICDDKTILSSICVYSPPVINHQDHAFGILCLLNKHVTVNSVQHLISYSKQGGKHSQFQSTKSTHFIFPVVLRWDITWWIVDINVQSGLAVYLPTGHRALASTHVTFELQGQAEICAWQQSWHTIWKMMSKPWCCPSVLISHSHTFSLLSSFFISFFLSFLLILNTVSSLLLKPAVSFTKPVMHYPKS